MYLRETRSLLICLLLSTGAAGAQDLVITNAREVVGNGAVVPNGAVVVRDGKVVSAGPPHRRARRASGSMREA
jgi:imidazolonepropionase-like amidohydrolase